MNGSNSSMPHGLGKPAERALAAAGYTRLEQLANASEEELLNLHGFGPKALRILRFALAEQGLAFQPETAVHREEED